jgi:hypothetical protein
MATEIVGTSTTSYLWPIINDFIIPGCQDMFYNETFLLDQLKTSSKDVVGRQILLYHKLQRNRSAGTAKERGTLPVAKTRVFKETSAGLRFFYVPVDFSGPEMRQTRSKGAKIDLIADGFDDAMKGGLEEMNFILWGDGSARRCQVNGSPSYSAGTGLTTVTFDHGSSHHIFPGMDVQFSATELADGPTAYEVVSVPSSTTFTVRGDASAVADDSWVYRYGGYSSGYDIDPWGLQIHVNEDNGVHSLYQGIDRTAAGFEAWKSYYNDNSGSGRYLTSILLIQHIRTHKAFTGEYPDLIICDPATFGSFVLLLESKGSGTDYVVSKAGFAKDVKFVYAGQEMTMRVADDCPSGSMYFLTKKTLEIREAFKLQWDMEGGGKLVRDKTTDSYWGRMLWYMNLVCLNNMKNSVLKDITGDSISS